MIKNFQNKTTIKVAKKFSNKNKGYKINYCKTLRLIFK